MPSGPGKLSRHMEFQMLCDRLRKLHRHRVLVKRWVAGSALPDRQVRALVVAP
jgi:hypothetical protein